MADDNGEQKWAKRASLYPVESIMDMDKMQTAGFHQFTGTETRPPPVASPDLSQNYYQDGTEFQVGINRRRPGTFPSSFAKTRSGNMSIERSPFPQNSPRSSLAIEQQHFNYNPAFSTQTAINYPPHIPPSTGYDNQQGHSAAFPPMSAYPSYQPTIGFSLGEPRHFNNPTSPGGQYNHNATHFNQISPETLHSRSLDIPDGRRQSAAFDAPLPMPSLGASPYSPSNFDMNAHGSSNQYMSPPLSPNPGAIFNSPPNQYMSSNLFPNPAVSPSAPSQQYMSSNLSPNTGVSPNVTPMYNASPNPPRDIGFSAFLTPDIGSSPYASPNTHAIPHLQPPPTHPVTMNTEPQPSCPVPDSRNYSDNSYGQRNTVDFSYGHGAAAYGESQIQGTFGQYSQPAPELDYLSLDLSGLYGGTNKRLSMNLAHSAAYDFAHPSQDTSGNDGSQVLTVPVGELFEPLEMIVSCDLQRESFLSMVADLKKTYVSTDESTNPGFLLNPIKEHHVKSQQIKVIVHSKFLPSQSMICNCSTDDDVDHIIRHTLGFVSSFAGKSHPVDFVLKVYNQTEYLTNDLPLARFDYIHSCLKFGTDVKLELLLRDEIPKPFLRTITDDSRALQFPKEDATLNNGAITFQEMTKVLYTFYQKADVFLSQNLQFLDREQSVRDLEISVKEMCSRLANVETQDITESLTRLKKTHTTNSSGSLSNPDCCGQLQATGTFVSPEEEVKSSIRDLVKAVKILAKIYCLAFNTDYGLASDVETNQGMAACQDVTEIQEHVNVKVASLHRLPSDWPIRYNKYVLVCSLYHGRRCLGSASTSFRPAAANSHQGIVWNEKLHFKNAILSKLPCETRMCFLLRGQEIVHDGGTTVAQNVVVDLCIGAVQLFSEKGFLLQSGQLVPLAIKDSMDASTTYSTPLLCNSLLLQINLTDFEKNITYPELTTHAIEVKAFSTLSPDKQSRIQRILEKHTSLFSQPDLQYLWTHRHYLADRPALLPCILKGPLSWDWADLPEIYGLLNCWSTLSPSQALELLTPDFPDVQVRRFATEILGQLPADDLICFLPQMIQALKFESYHNSPLAKLLLEQSCKSPRFAHQFFWLLRGIASQEPSFQRRYKMLFIALANVSGEALCRELKKQEELVGLMTNATEQVKTARDKDISLNETLPAIAEMISRKGRMFLPHNLGMEVTGLDVKSCSYFSSNAVPMKFVFENSNMDADPHYLIYKIGDDLRQDMLTMQIIDIMDSLWLHNDLDLKMVKFTCLTTGPEKGIIDMVRKSETLHKIQARFGMMGSFKDEPILAWLQEHNPSVGDYRKALENFTLSCAGYCVATYILGVCDRHNDNIMIKETGHMFHIDFGKFLGDSQMFGNIKRDRVPFVFTSDMAYVITNGGKRSEGFQVFVDLCCQAFNILRQNADLLRSLFTLMSRSGIHMVSDNAARYVNSMLLLDLTNVEATAKFTRMIEDSLSSFFTKVNFLVHNLAHKDAAPSKDGPLLSFVPKVFSEETDGKIKSMELFGHEKRYTPEKHYIFIFMIVRVNQAQPSFLFRHFTEILEWRDKLNANFIGRMWPDFSTRLVLGRSNIQTVADSRKMETENLIKFLWNCGKEIIESDLVYTFFHPLIRDQEEAENSRTKSEAPRQPGGYSAADSSGIQGEVKLSIQYQKGALQIMVMHVRDLAEEHFLPSAYVKARLLPDPADVTKVKTRIVRRTCNPTYNELLQYRMPLKRLQSRILLVTVWNEDVFMLKKRCLGAVYIRPSTLDLNQDNTAWHKLGQLQLGD